MGNSSYSFMLIVFKLYRCFGHGLKMCRFVLDIILRIFFVTLFHKLSLVTFWAFKIYYQDMNVPGYNSQIIIFFSVLCT